MKNVLIASALSILTANTALAQNIVCSTDTGKNISVFYASDSLSNPFIITLTVAGEDNSSGADIRVTRGSGILVSAPDFRNGEGLSLKILGRNSSYKIGNGNERPMNCQIQGNSQPKNDGI